MLEFTQDTEHLQDTERLHLHIATTTLCGGINLEKLFDAVMQENSIHYTWFDHVRLGISLNVLVAWGGEMGSL